MKYRHSRNQVFLINYHLVWCPKRRKKVLIGKIAQRLKEIFNQVAKEKDIDILALEIMPDHLHLFVSCQPQMTIHKIVKAFKGRSSNILRKEFPQLLKLPSLWTNSYFVSTAGNISHKTIQEYIENQSKK
jgi:putative transposase